MSFETSANQPEFDPLQGDTPALKRARMPVGSVQAEVVELSQCQAHQIHGETVTLRGGKAHQVHAQSATISNSAVTMVHAGNINITNGAIAIASSSEANVTGRVGMMIGQSVTLNNESAGLVVTGEVHGGKIHSVIFLAGKSDGQVETIVDQRSVALFGLMTGLAMGLVLSLLRLIKR